MRINLLWLVVLCVVFACGVDNDPVPKPRAYPRVMYPDRSYTSLARQECPLSFEYPGYGHIEMQTSFFGEKPVHPCWFDIVMPVFDARLHCSYYHIGEDESTYDALVEDAFKIANKINQRSNYMDEIRIRNAHGVSGLILEFKGPAASPMHFFLSDTNSHFFKASLYYNARVRPDSLEPITQFIQEDMAHLINSFQWKE